MLDTYYNPYFFINIFSNIFFQPIIDDIQKFGLASHRDINFKSSSKNCNLFKINLLFLLFLFVTHRLSDQEQKNKKTEIV